MLDLTHSVLQGLGWSGELCLRAFVRVCVCMCVFYAQSDRTVMLGRILLVVMENHCETKTLEASVGLV